MQNEKSKEVYQTKTQFLVMGRDASKRLAFELTLTLELALVPIYAKSTTGKFELPCLFILQADPLFNNRL